MYYEIIHGYSPVGDIFLIALCVVCAVVAKETFLRSSRTTLLFKIGVVDIIIACTANVFTYYFAMNEWEAIYVILARDIYHSLLLTLFLIYEYYLVLVIGFEKKHLLHLIHVGIFINFFGVIFDCLSPFTGWGLHLENGIWQDSSWNKPYTVAYILNMIFIAIILLTKKTMLISKVRYIIIFTQIICGLFVFVESAFGHNSYMALTFALPVIVVLLLLHSNPYNQDTGALGAESFDDYLKDRNKKGKKDHFLCIMFYTDRTFVMPVKLGKVFYHFYNGILRDARLFNPVSGCYLLAIKDEKNPDVEIEVNKLIEEIFPPYYEEYRIGYKIIAFSNVKFDSISSFTDMYYYYLYKISLNDIMYITENDISEYNRWRYICDELKDIALNGNLEDDRVLVYCQPVLNTRTEMFDSAEALMRLELSKLGMVYPDEFIHIAEEMGYIHTLSLIILNKTCKYIKKIDDKGFDLKRISVNFSITELKNNNFMSDYEKVINDNGIGYGRIGVEFTESRNDADYKKVVSAVDRLKDLGSIIYLDDFGTGYSNIDRILSLKVNIVKFDRSLVEMSEKDEKYREMVESFAKIFHLYGYMILYEGIDNEINENYCKSAFADYLQGYKYSKPIPIEELDKFLEKYN